MNENCNGKCEAGYFCLAGSRSAQEKACGGVAVYCPLGSGSPINASEGFYTVGNTELTRSGERPCEKGHYCQGGVKYKCEKGTYNPLEKQSLKSKCIACPVGHYCEEAATEPTPCPAGTFGSVTNLATMSCSGFCEPGYYCPVGSTRSNQEPCPEGRVGKEPGLTTEACSRECDYNSGYCVSDASYCPSGYYCPPATVNPIPCGGADVFCPVNSSAPQPVDPGYYTVNHHGEAESDEARTRVAQVICPKGHYCENGVKQACPKSTYGDQVGLSYRGCSGHCAPGFYCELGSISRYQKRCGPGKYCPSASNAPSVISPGYYGVGGDYSTRQAQVECEAGHRCVDGIRIPCEPGTYQLFQGASSCEKCPTGHYCERGASAPVKCPAGVFGATEGLGSAQCSGTCAAGYYCPKGSTRNDQFLCSSGVTDLGDPDQQQATLPVGASEGEYYGDEHGSYTRKVLDKVYCPAGSGSPIAVDPNHYAAGGREGARTHQISCDVSNELSPERDPTTCASILITEQEKS